MASPTTQYKSMNLLWIPPESQRLLMRVYKKIFIEKQNSHHLAPLTDKWKRTSILTGLSITTLKKLEKGELGFTMDNVDRAFILSEFNKYILEYQIVPTTKMLFEYLQEKIPPYIDIAQFRKLLGMYDFVWTQASNGYAVVERPVITFERYSYLKLFLQNLDDNVPIYFIDENALNTENYEYLDIHDGISKKDKCNLYITYAISKTKVICTYNTSKINKTVFKTFIKDYLLPELHEKSVIVFNNLKHHCEGNNSDLNFTTDSLKCDMEDYLDKYDIPHRNNMAKWELLSLIEKYTKRQDKSYVIDDILQHNGHVALRLPNHLNLLTPTRYVHKLVDINIKVNEETPTDDPEQKFNKFKDLINLIFDSITADQLTKYFDHVVNEMRCMFDIDTKVDKVFDVVMEKMSSHKFQSDDEDSDVPEYNFVD